VVGMFLFVFGLQEGSSYDWGTIRGPITIWGVIATGVVVLVAFVLWQRHRGDDALMPLQLFHSRNFSMANVAGWAVTFAMTGIFFPFTIFLQVGLGLSPLRSALVGAGGSILSGIVAPFAGRLSDKIPGKWIVATGFAILTVVVFALHELIEPDADVWKLVVVMCFFGIGTGLLFSPLANLATSGLDHRNAGAGAGAFNTNRQIGGVVGSAAIVALFTSRLGIEIPNAAQSAAQSLPEALRQPFVQAFAHVDQDALAGGSSSGFTPPKGVPQETVAQFQDAAAQAVHSGLATAVSQTMLLTVIVLAIGLVSALVMKGIRPHHHGEGQEQKDAPAGAAAAAH